MNARPLGQCTHRLDDETIALLRKLAAKGNLPRLAKKLGCAVTSLEKGLGGSPLREVVAVRITENVRALSHGGEAA